MNHIQNKFSPSNIHSKLGKNLWFRNKSKRKDDKNVNILSIAMLLFTTPVPLLYTQHDNTHLTHTQHFSLSKIFAVFYLKKDTQNQHFCLLIECHDFACNGKTKIHKKKVLHQTAKKKVDPPKNKKIARLNGISLDFLPIISWLKHVVHETVLPIVKHSLTAAIPTVSLISYLWVFRVFNK